MAHTRSIFAKCLVVAAVGLMSVFCVPTNTFTIANNATQNIPVTLNFRSGDSATVTVSGQSILPEDIGLDVVQGVTIYGVYDASGTNTTIPYPLGGYVTTAWNGDGTGVTLDYQSAN